MLHIRVVASCLLIAVLAHASDWVTVVRVIDGDTFETDSGEVVRLIGVDAPETKHPYKVVEAYGQEAYVFAKDALAGKTVRLEYDRLEKDKYGRLLAYVILEDGSLFNAEMIRHGYARVYTKYAFDSTRMAEFLTYERLARQAGVGLWAIHPDHDAQPTKATRAEGRYWYNSETGVLHNSSCRWYGKTKHGYFTEKAEGRDCDICGGAAERK